MKLIKIDNSKCKTCYACVRVCPVKAIVVRPNQDFPSILHNRCIGCGSCILSCGPNALTYETAEENVKSLLASEKKTAAIVDPSISAEFGDIADFRRFVEMIRRLGFDFVMEVAFGADLIALRYKELVDNFRGKYYITSNCPSVTSYVEKFYPGLVNNLAPLISPVEAMAKVVHHDYGQDVQVVFVGPCISAKEDILRYTDDGKVDEVLTYRELRRLFDENNINEGSVEYSDFDPPFGHKGQLFPIRNGMLQSVEIDDDLLTGTIIPTVGPENTLEAVKTFDKNIEKVRRHFDLYYCHGCIMGPGTSPHGEKFIRRSQVIDYTNKRLNGFDLKQWEKDIERFKDMDFSRSFTEDDQRIPMPPQEQIDEVLKVISKGEQDRDEGCGACGYASCTEFAVAVSKGLAKTEMCMTYTLKSQNDYIHTLKTTNEKLAKTEKALKESESVARREHKEAREANETINTMLQKLPVGVVIVDADLEIIHANKSFIDLLGEDAKMIDEVIPGLKGADLKSLVPYNFYNLFDFVLRNNDTITNKDTKVEEEFLNVSVFPIKTNDIAGAVVRDMRSPEVRKEQVMRRVTEVIDENLRMVQQIGFLLGEGASKTERMLNSIIESYQTEKDKTED